MTNEIPQTLSSRDRVNLLRQDLIFKNRVAIWSKIKESPQRGEFGTLIRERRAEILDAVDPQAEVIRSNRRHLAAISRNFNARLG